jgi:predicted AlkP superfamily phosphohydrolase/phosphomutase
VDWSKTRAYTGNVGEEYLPVNINLQGREPFGIVSPSDYEEVREELRRVLNDCHVPAVLAVHRSEEIFDIEDPRRSAAPDLVIETLSGAVQSDFALAQPETYEDPSFRKACHRRRGMFLLSGPDVIPGRRAANLFDLPATILAWMGLPVPARFTGEVLAEQILGLEAGARSDAQWENADRRYFDDDDEDGVRRKLESLGYL